MACAASPGGALVGFGRIKDYHTRLPRRNLPAGADGDKQGDADLDAIAEVEGVDGVFIGPNDLSADMGYLGNWQHPEVWKVMEEAAKRIRKAGKAPGILVGEADGQRCLDMGYLFVAVGSILDCSGQATRSPPNSSAERVKLRGGRIVSVNRTKKTDGPRGKPPHPVPRWR